MLKMRLNKKIMTFIASALNSGIVLLTFWSALSACSNPCVTVNGPVTEEIRDIGSFTAVTLNISADLYLTQNQSANKLRIKADESLMDKFDIRVEGGELIIDMKGCYISSGPMEIYVNTNKIESISVSGSGSVYSESNLIGARLDLAIDGSGDIKIESQYQFIRGDISGSGDIYISGATERFEAMINGSGDLKAASLAAKSVNVAINGSGDAFVTATDYLEASIDGSGDIVYSGNPVNKEINVNGSGSIRAKE
jgi:hypothetical protein